MRNPRQTLTPFIVCIAFLFVYSTALAGKLYKWVDENGVVHFSDRQPATMENLKGPVQEDEVQDRLSAEPPTQTKTPSLPIHPVTHTTLCSFTIQGEKSLGTGFFISENGYAITCKHVVEGDKNFKAILDNKNSVPIRIISTSRIHDLALILVITSQKTPYLKLRHPGTLTPGERVLAVGSSLGLQATVTDGVFTGYRDRKDRQDRLIQFSAPINPGNSGGPLIDQDGNLIGVVSLKYAMQDNIPIAGVGFAVPSDYVKEEYSTYLPIVR
ncbi:MAG: trypsin-like peptidase domain-containing protein [Deltaproteobacteria bacterium]|nr:trypsin-like peptidase domain-containing protein [Deltaproteobacteria bacterium]